MARTEAALEWLTSGAASDLASGGEKALAAFKYVEELVAAGGGKLLVGKAPSIADISIGAHVSASPAIAQASPALQAWLKEVQAVK